MLFKRKSKDEKLKEKLSNTIKRTKLKDQIRSIKVNTFTKALVGSIVLVALLDLQLSYILAFLDKVQIAEELSKQVCTTIIGVALVYMIRAYFDTKADIKNENSKKIVEKNLINKVYEVLNNAGITEIDLDDLISEIKITDNNTNEGDNEENENDV